MIRRVACAVVLAALCVASNAEDEKPKLPTYLRLEKTFTIDKKYLHMLVGGGDFPTTRVDLLIGSEAVNQLDTEANSINAYLTLEQYQDLSLNHDLTIVLDQPMHRYLAFCKIMLDIEN